MVIRSEFGIYRVLEKLLKEAKEPLTCVDLFDHAEIREYAPTANRVSDYLGHMWRRGLLNRFHAPRTATNFSRYAYTWKEEPPIRAEVERKPIPAPVIPGIKQRMDLFEKDGELVIELSNFVITVKTK